MPAPGYLSRPDSHLNPAVAAVYDDSHSGRFTPEAVQPAVDFLADLAGGGAAVEFAVGTGRLALPLSEIVTPVHGIDFSEPMLAELKKKDGAERVSLTVGDMTTTQVCTDAAVVYLVYNTIENLRTQQQQVDCFHNAAAHLAAGGRFIIETGGSAAVSPSSGRVDPPVRRLTTPPRIRGVRRPGEPDLDLTPLQHRRRSSPHRVPIVSLCLALRT